MPEQTNVTFTQKLSEFGQPCPASNVNCRDSYSPRTVWGPPYGSVWYWRVAVGTALGTVYSPISTFTARNPADRDKDGVPDAKDNCPAKTNADQRDSNHDGKGDACQPDRTPPQARALPGSGRRGHTIFLDARFGDDRGSVRLRVWLSFSGHVVLQKSFGWVDAPVGTKHSFYSENPLPGALPTGTYQSCIKVWDRAGNHSASCAPYHIS